MKTLRIALDWTPNINHIGIFIAKELGYYQEKGIEIEILNPLEDNYKITPGKKLELGLTDFTIAPFETVISLNNKKNIVDAIAVFAILQEDISSIASLKSSNLDSPKLLDGKTYASYKARYEDHIVKEMVKNDGGTGNMEIVYPDKLGIWNTLLEGKADATWIFDNWEGVEAKTKHIELNKFSMSEFGIPYCYSPVIIARNTLIISNKNDYSNFIKATQKGYLYAAENKSRAITILKGYLTDYDKANIDISQSIDLTAPYFGNDQECGFMKPERINIFLKWLVEHNLENKKIIEQNLFTNDLLK
ncbi:ABC transporter substrate-binding protein [Winogradskyella sp. UBA3174]|uniref:ABC transporter substrate-binding protein n=1 Tax=Winogradskyella sp. UBA3174 TaxID=1947785 RepID=UPI0025E5FCF3|nr:ABC transporter substrate-binding protein [Winogradskyella sp. UBA3174]|tara:strand:+ start:3675 stop:4586 length:912 start_codon:yes stop_codon:yes gene_type:complete